MSDTTHEPEGEQPTRRDFIYVATGMMGAVGAAAVAWPFIDQMRPDAAVRAAGAPVTIDLSPIEPGGTIVITWRSRPYFIRQLTEDEIVAADDLAPGEMKEYQPAEERIGGPDEAQRNWVIVSATCTHLGCVPNTIQDGAEGWFCPCHGSVFDVVGRILRGPAATNLPLPPYIFTDETTLIVGTDEA